MSASTLSVTANPRRRPTSLSDVKQGVEIVNDSTPIPETTPGQINNPNEPTSHSLSHSHSHSQTILDRSKKPTTTTTQPTRTRTRKPTGPTHTQAQAHHHKSPKPRWVTVARVFAKNFVLLLILLGLVQMVRRLVVKSGDGSVAGLAEMEGRIAGVETSLRTTSKMLQVQVEVVDKKVESLAGELRRDVGRRIEENVRGLEEKVKEVEREVEEAREREREYVKKCEVEKMYEELKKGQGGGGGGGEEGVKLDEIRVMAREVVEREIEKHASDGLGRVDYALESGGGKVVRHSEVFSGGRMSVGWLWRPVSGGVSGEANKMLRPSFGEPGQCFALKGSYGFVVVRLRTAVVPQAVTLEHVSKSVAYDRSSAPKHCRVSGWLQGRQGQEGLETESIDNEKMFPLTEFTYDLGKSNAQTFNVFEAASSVAVDTVRFDFSSNHGSPTHTCIYRLRVHGYEPNSVQMIGSDS